MVSTFRRSKPPPAIVRAEGRSGDGDPSAVIGWLDRCREGGVILTEGDRQFLPWGEVAGDVRKVAAHLGTSGVGPGTRVGLRGHNSYEWLVLDLALISLGAIAVAFPVPEFEGHSTEALIARFGLAAVFAGPGSRDGTHRSEVALEHLLERRPLQVTLAGADPYGDPVRDEPVFTLVFSSGTAGRVKCLILAWRGVERLLREQAAAFPLGTGDRILIALPLSTFQQRYLCYLAIEQDCTIVLSSTAKYRNALAKARPTVMLGPPAFYEFCERRYRSMSKAHKRILHALAQAAVIVPSVRFRSAWRRRVYGEFHLAFGGTMRLMLVGSAPVRREFLEIFAELGFNLFQIYGMTEVGFITWNLPKHNRIGSVGKEVYPDSLFLDDGEIIVRHDWHLCIGYVDEDATSISGVFRGGHTVATGDLGEIDPDGYLYVTGRRKNLLITNGGQKIQIEDLESELEALSVVNSAGICRMETGRYAAVIWFRGLRTDAEKIIKGHLTLMNNRLLSEMAITQVALIEGTLEPGSPLMNRNLKLNRDAILAAVNDSDGLIPC